MKTKSILLIAVSLGFGLIAAIGMSQVLGQKTTEQAPEVEMVDVFVASKPLEIGDALKLEENLNVKSRPVTDVPENAIRNAEELENMIAVQRVPKDVLIVKDYIMDKYVAGIGQQPPIGYRAYSFKTELVDTHHNSLHAGDRVDVVGVFRVRGIDGEEGRRPSTFLKNIEVFQVNDKHYIGVDGEDNDKISTITLLLTPKQVEVALLAEDVASVVRFVKTNRSTDETDEEDSFDLQALLDQQQLPNTDEVENNAPEGGNTGNVDRSASQKLIDQLNSDAKSEVKESSSDQPYDFKMKIYKAGVVQEFGFKKGRLPQVIDQTTVPATQPTPQPAAPTVTAEDDFSDTPVEEGPDGSEEDLLRG